MHLAPRPGTNLALMNALLHEIIANDWIDHDYIDEHVVGFEQLAQLVENYSTGACREICDVPAAQIREAARILGQAERLLSTVLQGFYQSHQRHGGCRAGQLTSTWSAACWANPVRIYQMNGQPTAQNTRECGADGDLPGFRNWNNPNHVKDLARCGNVEPERIPSYSAPTHLMQMLRYVEEGSIAQLWVTGPNPAVSLPELARIRAVSQR